MTRWSVSFVGPSLERMENTIGRSISGFKAAFNLFYTRERQSCNSPSNSMFYTLTCSSLSPLVLWRLESWPTSTGSPLAAFLSSVTHFLSSPLHETNDGSQWSFNCSWRWHFFLTSRRSPRAPLRTRHNKRWPWTKNLQRGNDRVIHQNSEVWYSPCRGLSAPTVSVIHLRVL